MYSSGDWQDNYFENYSYGARPSISLRPGITFKSGGDGSANNPYEVDMTD